MNEEPEILDNPEDEPQERGQKVASFMGRVTLYDPDPDDVSRAGRPLVPDDPTVKRVEEAIAAALAELGFAVTVDLTRTDNER